MRVIVFFDLPVLTTENMRDYRSFRRFLIKSGFMMMQESVYSKLAPNTFAADALEENLQKNKPKEGLVQVLRITEKQYINMKYIVGEKKTNVLDTKDKLVIL